MPGGQVVRQRRPWSFEGGISYGAGDFGYTRAISISSTAIVGTSAGQLGHAQGVELVPAPGAGFFLELVSAALFYDFQVAAYTAGGNVTVNYGGGGAAISGVISAANSLGAAADKFVMFGPLAAAAYNVSANVGINLVAAAAFTQPGTAAGIVYVKTTFRVRALPF